MFTSIIQLSSTLLFLLGLAIPFFTPIYLYCVDNSTWAIISIIASIISAVISTQTTKYLIGLQYITNTAIIANIIALIYHILLLTAVITLAPTQIWWILILTTWEIARHPLQSIITISQQDILTKPIFYSSNQALCDKAAAYSGLQIFITGVASIIAAITLLLR